MIEMSKQQIERRIADNEKYLEASNGYFKSFADQAETETYKRLVRAHIEVCAENSALHEALDILEEPKHSKFGVRSALLRAQEHAHNFLEIISAPIGHAVDGKGC